MPCDHFLCYLFIYFVSAITFQQVFWFVAHVSLGETHCVNIKKKGSAAVVDTDDQVRRTVCKRVGAHQQTNRDDDCLHACKTPKLLNRLHVCTLCVNKKEKKTPVCLKQVCVNRLVRSRPDAAPARAFERALPLAVLWSSWTSQVTSPRRTTTQSGAGAREGGGLVQRGTNEVGGRAERLFAGPLGRGARRQRDAKRWRLFVR